MGTNILQSPPAQLLCGLLLAAALMLISGQVITDVVGIALIGGLFAWQSLKHRQAAGTPARATPDKEPAR